ncbi:uncharacterized protein B0T15DRAFT_509532 [Chaetomium strumarium]|uniref:F-box domain-containing protein n=1 Tax=Chaetomium strumarium TaxID=1170767 RepID=A0AAJ0H0E9_9PEZI|nr:hypothetical protein B0T15DRAFT_509532 [Chaetomium strumarium]
MSLVKLPYELVSYVVDYLELSDVFSLSLSCKKFLFLFQEANISKWLLESKAPYSKEARDARVNKRYASGLRRLTKRQRAVASVSPYLVAVVAFSEHWMYENGILCYVRNHNLRILDLHHPGSHEIVVDIAKLLLEAVQDPQPRRKCKFQLLYYSHNIVSCVYKQRRHNDSGQRSNWLVAVNPREARIVAVRQLVSTSRLFVRNNNEFLFYGTTYEAVDGYDRWAIGGFDIRAGAGTSESASTWLGLLNIPMVIGTDIGATVCFEIFGGYFYGVSNQGNFQDETGDWISYYSCFRFPLARQGFQKFKALPRERIWRRNHTEGPIDDRWTFLRIFEDESTGELKAIESRKEWLAGSISARRTYYTTPISFDDPTEGSVTGRSLEGTGSTTSAAKNRQATVPRTRLRDPNTVHPGDDRFTFAVNLSKCPIRSYHPPCHTFIDLVDESDPFNPADQRIRLRGGSRHPRSPGGLARPECLPAAQGELDSRAALLRQIDGLYKSESNLFWPPKPNSADPDPALAELYAMLSPPGHFGSLRGSWDERSIVYATGNRAGGIQALIFLSFDPAIYLNGTPPYSGSSSLGGKSKEKGSNTAKKGPLPQSDTTCCLGEGFNLGQSTSGTHQDNEVSWRRFEPAAYREISRGYHFAL